MSVPVLISLALYVASIIVAIVSFLFGTPFALGLLTLLLSIGGVIFSVLSLREMR